MEGVWYYNSGRSWYHVYPDTYGELQYYQMVGIGIELHGDIKACDASGWEKEADLTNGAKIRFRLDGKFLASSYQRAGSEQWRPVVLAHQTQDDSGQGDGMSSELALKANDRSQEKGSKTSVSSSALGDFVRQVVLDVFLETDQEFSEVPVSALNSSMYSLLKAAPRLHYHRATALDRMPRLPLARNLDEYLLEKHRSSRKEKAQQPDPRASIPPVPMAALSIGLAHPVSYNEEQMLRLFIGDPFNPNYNLSAHIRLEVKMDTQTAVRSHLILIHRHDVLRSAYRQDDPTNLLRTLSRSLPGGVKVITVPTEDDAARCQMMDRFTAHQLGISALRCNVYLAKSNDVPSMGVNLHHILADADGMGLYMQELHTISFLLASGVPEHVVADALPKLPVQFVDFSYWQKSLEAKGLLDHDLSYWYNQVVSSTPPAVLDVPIDKPRPRVWSAAGGQMRMGYQQELLAVIAEASGRATPMAVTCANFGLCLSRLTGQPAMELAVPFALRNMPELTNLIGNFLNMMPIRISHEADEPYVDLLARVATSSVNVQKYSLSPFVQLVDATRHHYPVTDPSRNPIYGAMVDMVPNEADTAAGLLGVMDVFLFLNTRHGSIYSVDAVWSLTILEEHLMRAMLLQMHAITLHAARSVREPVPRSLPMAEEAQLPKKFVGVDVASLLLRVGLLPHVVPLRSGFDATGQLAGVRRARRFKRHSGLELQADYPPAALVDRLPPLAPSSDAAEDLQVKPARRPPKAKPTFEEMLPAIIPEARRTRKAVFSQALSRGKRNDVAALWAETKRANELIPLDMNDSIYQDNLDQDYDKQLLRRGRERHSQQLVNGRSL